MGTSLGVDQGAWPGNDRGWAEGGLGTRLGWYVAWERGWGEGNLETKLEVN